MTRHLAARPAPRFASCRRPLPRLLAAIALALPLALAAQSPPAYRIGQSLPVAKPATAAGYRQINFDDLMPADWDPMAAVRKLDLSKLQDGDPRATEALEQLREAWSKAPVNPKLDKQRVRIAGFVVPLDREGEAVSEFLLVPYFGACIHTPPPPPNQIIHVVPEKPVKGLQTMDTLWISGTLTTRPSGSPFGPVGYRLEAKHTEPYQRPAR